jgi:hypothetical protein
MGIRLMTREQSSADPNAICSKRKCCRGRSSVSDATTGKDQTVACDIANRRQERQ